MAACWATPAPTPVKKPLPAEQVIGGRAVESPNKRASESRPEPWQATAAPHAADRLGVAAQRVERARVEGGKTSKKAKVPTTSAPTSLPVPRAKVR